MGCGGSKDAGVVAPPTPVVQSTYKILLLGAGESGKSTVLKQVKLIYGRKIHQKEIQQCSEAIRKNAVDCMQAVLQAMAKLDIPLGNPDNAAAKARILTLEDTEPFSMSVARDIKQLWTDSGVRLCYGERQRYWILDAADYYFDHVMRIAEEDFVPSEDDIVMTRVRTTGIDNTEFQEPPRTYSVLDVGGQRNERKKWIKCFDQVKAIVYLVALSGYNQVLFEDSLVTRMHESLKLFEQVVSNPLFKETPIFLFLNKKDIFETMIRATSLKVCFPEYTGPDGDVHRALDYVENQFARIMEKACPGKKLYVQVVAARVRMDMKIAWTEVKDTIRKVYHDDAPSTGRRSITNDNTM